MNSEGIFGFFTQVIFRVFADVFSGLQLVNNKKIQLFRWSVTVLGSVKLKDSQLEAWTSSGLSRNPLYTLIVLLNKYVFSVQTSAR